MAEYELYGMQRMRQVVEIYHHLTQASDMGYWVMHGGENGGPCMALAATELYMRPVPDQPGWEAPANDDILQLADWLVGEGFAVPRYIDGVVEARFLSGACINRFFHSKREFSLGMAFAVVAKRLDLLDAAGQRGGDVRFPRFVTGGYSLDAWCYHLNAVLLEPAAVVEAEAALVLLAD